MPSSRGDLPDPGIQQGSPALQTDSLLSEHQGSPSGGLEGFKQYQVKEREADSLVRVLKVERV